MTHFENAQHAFEFMYDHISNHGIDNQNTKAMFNVGFYIDNPKQRVISTPYRKWKLSYAIREWDWYVSGNKSAIEISKHAPIWKRMMDAEGNVNSNYGYQWNRDNQLQKAIEILKQDPESRRSAISLFDGKEYDKYEKDTVCTYSVQFTIHQGKLCITVLMRSNDLWYGFCNDQYCFSRLQECVADELGLEVGWYYHFATNMHIYNDKLNKK